MTAENPVVLVVEDERSLADLYAEWLSLDGGYEVRTAYGGETALEELDETVDVVLLDRRMPDISGDDVLDEIGERGLEPRVVMVTAIEPDFDVVEMGFDQYLVKPVSREDLLTTLEQMERLDQYDEIIQQYYQLVAKTTTLEESKPESELANSTEYQDLVQELEDVREEADTLLENLSEDEYKALF
jgi:two-component system response regulator AdeR